MTPPATSWTRSTPPPRTGSRASPTSRSSSTRWSTAGTNPDTPATRTATTSSTPTARLQEGRAAQHLPLGELGASHRLQGPRHRRRAARARRRRGPPGAQPETDGDCIPAFSQSVQLGTYSSDQGTPDANFGATVNGNYGFGDGCFNGTIDDTATDFDPSAPDCTGGAFTALPAGDYLVSVDIPDDDVTGHPKYKVTGEEDINIAHGNQIIPQVPPPPAPVPCTPSTCSATARTTTPRSPATGRRAPRRHRPGLDPGRQPDLQRNRRTPYEGTGRSRCATPSW